MGCSLSARACFPTQEVFTEMEEKYGEVEEMNVCDNLGDHLVGNVYVKVGGLCVRASRCGSWRGFLFLLINKSFCKH